jgi:hypothetical protein
MQFVTLCPYSVYSMDHNSANKFELLTRVSPLPSISLPCALTHSLTHSVSTPWATRVQTSSVLVTRATCLSHLTNSHSLTHSLTECAHHGPQECRPALYFLTRATCLSHFTDSPSLTLTPSLPASLTPSLPPSQSVHAMGHKSADQLCTGDQGHMFVSSH